MIEISPDNAAKLDLRSSFNAFKRTSSSEEKIYPNGSTWLPFVDDPLFNGMDDHWCKYSTTQNIFHENPDVMTIGCSMTASTGLLREFTWPYIIGSFTGQSVNNCSRPGSSIIYQINAAIQMIKHYGKPKVIYALFPELSRGMVCDVDDRSTMSRIHKHLLWSPLLGAYISPHSHMQHVADLLNPATNSSRSGKYSIYSYTASNGNRELIPSEWFIQSNIEAIYTLSMLCNLSGIDLKFCSWEETANTELNNLHINGFSMPMNRYDASMPNITNNKITALYSMSPSQWTSPLDESCSHVSPDLKHKSIWHTAADGFHPGIHSQIHFAEHFIGQVIPQEFIDAMPLDCDLPDLLVAP